MLDTKGKEQWYDKLIRIINSTVCFVLAYAVITLGGFFSMAMVGKIFKFDANIYYFGIRFMLNGNKWSRLKVTLIYSSYAFFALLFGLFMLYIFDRVKRKPAVLNVFLVWSFVIGTAMFAAQGLIASFGANEFNSPFYQNFAVVFAWWFLPPPFVYATNIFFVILLLYFSINYPKMFLSFSYSFSKVNKSSRRRRYFIETAVVPFIIGAVATTALTFPMNMFVHGIYLFIIGIALLISWIALFYLEIMKDDVLKYKVLQAPGFIMMFMLALFVIFVKVYWRGIFIS
jgi:MFS family permease